MTLGKRTFRILTMVERNLCVKCMIGRMLRIYCPSCKQHHQLQLNPHHQIQKITDEQGCAQQSPKLVTFNRECKDRNQNRPDLHIVQARMSATVLPENHTWMKCRFGERGALSPPFCSTQSSPRPIAVAPQKVADVSMEANHWRYVVLLSLLPCCERIPLPRN